MDFDSLIDECSVRQIKLKLNGDKLKIISPKGKLDKELTKELKCYKDQIIHWLNSTSDQNSGMLPPDSESKPDDRQVPSYASQVDKTYSLQSKYFKPSEIEKQLIKHDCIKSSFVTTREISEGEKSLVAYVVPDWDARSWEHVAEDQSGEQVSEWKGLYDRHYKKKWEGSLDFNIEGWNSSYTNQAIPEIEMMEWVENTVARIEQLKPNNVLEIGCGTGLLLSRIAPKCKKYIGVDFSEMVLAQASYLCSKNKNLSHVQLKQSVANDLSWVESQSFDTIIINSVVQYFPSIQYLLDVVESALSLVKKGGCIFLGDLRNLVLLQNYHGDIQFYQDPHASREEISNRQTVHLNREEELVISPELFTLLKNEYERITHVEVLVKEGKYHNELSRYRFDAVLFVDHSEEPTLQVNWHEGVQTLKEMEEIIVSQINSNHGFYAVNNARVSRGNAVQDWFNQDRESKLCSAITQDKDIDPYDIYRLAEKLDFFVKLSWQRCDKRGRYDVVFLSKENTSASIAWPAKSTHKKWEFYASNPLAGKFRKKLLPQLKKYLTLLLPEHMIPEYIVILDDLPLSENGKVDDRALPNPDPLSRLK